MLVNLHIVNLALIDELDVDFAEGLNILTGETGAGKSIIIGSIGIGLGGRFDSSLLRNPDKDGMVELLFSVDDTLTESLKEEEIDVQDGELLISRRLAGGKSINRINGSTVTVAKLRKVAEMLISLHAQHEQRTLLQASRHLEIVDSYDQSIAGLKKKV
ncbi:MAG: AAA family ATPase, partial [Lachnospiraceae bacterium]|nr:AAA family ATPase [Lachnospiraceae bacterium]